MRPWQWWMQVPEIHAEPVHFDHAKRARVLASISVSGRHCPIRVGDTVRWDPPSDIFAQIRTLDCIATFLVVGCEKDPRIPSRYILDLGRIRPDVTVCGVTYRMPQMGHLVAEPDDPEPERQRLGPFAP
jgi:hypothetical protein